MQLAAFPDHPATARPSPDRHGSKPRGRQTAGRDRPPKTAETGLWRGKRSRQCPRRLTLACSPRGASRSGSALILWPLHHSDQNPAPSVPTSPKTAGSTLALVGRGVGSVKRTGVRFSFHIDSPLGCRASKRHLTRGAGTKHAGRNGSEEGGRTERRVVEVTREGE